jgi:hypothetical protein
MRVSIAGLKVSDHVKRMIQTCWELGGDPVYAGLKLRRWGHQLGYGGHFLSKSRRYSTLISVLWSSDQGRLRGCRLGSPMSGCSAMSEHFSV